MKPHLKVFRQRKASMIREAMEARDRAFSYRKFNVGVSALCFNEEDLTYRTFRGINIKPEEEGDTICGERISIGAARAEGFRLLVGLVVVGKQQPDGVTKIVRKVLPPCYKCRVFFRGLLGHGISPETLVYMLDPDTEEHETLSVAQILATYNGRIHA